jgi:hypothetical protein
MSAERFVKDARSALAALAGTGAVSAGPGTIKVWGSLSGRARSLGLLDLSTRIDALASHLEKRGALAYEPSVAVADEILAVYDRVEALASTLAAWKVEQAFAQGGTAS